MYPGVNGKSLPVLPTQLFEALFELILFIVLIIYFKKIKQYYLSIYLIGYSSFRFILEFFRGDSRGSVNLSLSPSQIVAIIAIVAGVLIILYQKNIIFKKIRQANLNEQCYIQKYGVYTRDKSVNMLRELKIMLDEKLISDEEYEQKRTDILSRF